MEEESKESSLPLLSSSLWWKALLSSATSSAFKRFFKVESLVFQLDQLDHFFKVESLVFQLDQLDHFRNLCCMKLAIDFLSPQLSNQSEIDSNSFGSFKSISIEWGRKYFSKFDWIYHPSQPIPKDKVMNKFTFWRNPSFSWAISAGSILEVMLLMISNDD